MSGFSWRDELDKEPAEKKTLEGWQFLLALSGIVATLIGVNYLVKLIWR